MKNGLLLLMGRFYGASRAMVFVQWPREHLVVMEYVQSDFMELKLKISTNGCLNIVCLLCDVDMIVIRI